MATYPKYSIINHISATRLLFIALAGLAIVACDEVAETSNVDDLMQRAAKKRAAGKIRASIIDLKTVLQKSPKNADARLLLGQVYLDVGDGKAAEKEANQARVLGANAYDVFDIEGSAWLLQNKHKLVFEKIAHGAGDTSGMRALGALFRGEALRAQGRLADAKKEFDLALTEYRKDINEDRPHLKITKPAESVMALVGLAKIAIRENSWELAQGLLEKAQSAAPVDTDVMALKGQLSFEKKDFAGAEEAYSKALKGAPYKAGFQLRVAHAQVAQKKYDEAIVNLDKIIKVFPKNILANYLRGLAAYRLGKYENAKAYTENVLKLTTEHVPTYLIAGSAAYALGQMEQANKYLTRYVSAVPGNSSARKLLGNVQLKLGRPDQAIATLRPINDAKSNDIALLSLIGAAAVAKGDLDTGFRYFNKASKAEPDNTGLLARASILQIAKGDTESGLRGLEDAVSRDANLTPHEVQLILNYIKENKFDDAIAAAKRLQERNPESPVGLTLQGLVEISRKDEAQALVLFDKALSLRPGDPSTSHNKAVLLLGQKNNALARKAYETALEHFPNNVETLMQLAQFEVLLGNRGEALRLLNKTLEVSPNLIKAKTRIARILVEDGKPDKALAVAQKGLREHPDNAALLETIGVAQLESQQFSDAVLTFKRITELAPDSLGSLTNLARASYMAGNALRAKESLRKILEMEPDHSGSMIVLGQIALIERDTKTVRELLPRLKELKADEVLVLLIETNLALAEGKPDDAIKGLKKLTTLRDVRNDRLRLSELLFVRGRWPEAVANLQEWLEKKPDDQFARFKLAQQFMTSGNWKEAKRELEKIIVSQPDFGPGQNNLAFVLFELRDVAGALKHAKLASQIDPGNPDFMDTLAVVHLEQGDAKAALTLLERASGRPSKSATSIKYHMAKALAALNRNAEAKDILTKILDGKVIFRERKDARVLLEKLSE